MRQIYAARDAVDAHAIKSLLDSEGIDVVVQGEHLGSAWGSIPIDPSTSPSVSVVRDEDFDRAVSCLENFSRTKSIEPEATHWKCDRCGELIKSQFTGCWKCSAQGQDETAATTEETPPDELEAEEPDEPPSSLVPGGAAAAQPTTRTNRELWAETGLVLLLIVLPSLYGSIATRFWRDSTRPSRTRVDRSIAYAVTDLGCIALVTYLIWRSGESWSEFGLVRPKWIVDPAVGVFCWGVVTVVRIVCLRCLYALFDPRTFRSSIVDEGSPQPAPLGFLEMALIVGSVALTATSEELVMRAYLIPRFNRLLRSSAKSVLLTACLFASLHIYQGFSGTVGAFLTGIVFGVLFCFYRRIWPFAIGHTINNLVAYWAYASSNA